eukprot:jgi/Tetstr1/441815/TSEL_030032.t1
MFSFLASGTVYALHKENPGDAREERARRGEPLRVRPLGVGSVLVRRASAHAPVQVGADVRGAMGPVQRNFQSGAGCETAYWLTDTMTTAGVETYHHHTEPTLLSVGGDNLCAISLGHEDEEFADTMRLTVALTSPVALLRAIRLRTIVIYLTDSEFDPSELLIHPFS